MGATRGPVRAGLLPIRCRTESSAVYAKLDLDELSPHTILVVRATGLWLQNSLTGEKNELIVPGAEDRPLTWYSCGPTVYDAAHLGHARNYVCLDILHRVLTNHFKLPVIQVVNVTDIDDKIVARAAAEQCTVSELTSKWESAFWHDLQLLNVLPPAAILRVTDHVDVIVDFVEVLVQV